MFLFWCHDLVTGIKWQDASCSLYDAFRKKYVHRWSSTKCRYDVLFGFDTPYEALEFSGKILNHLRARSMPNLACKDHTKSKCLEI